MRSLEALHRLCKMIALGHEVTNLDELIKVLEYWQRVRGTGD